LDINLNFKTKFIEDPSCKPRTPKKTQPRENLGLAIPDLPIPRTPEYEERAAAVEADLPTATDRLEQAQTEHFEETKDSTDYEIL